MEKNSTKSAEVFVYLADGTASSIVANSHVVLAGPKTTEKIKNGAAFNDVRSDEDTFYVVSTSNLFNAWSFLRKNHPDVFEEFKRQSKNQ